GGRAPPLGRAAGFFRLSRGAAPLGPFSERDSAGPDDPAAGTRPGTAPALSASPARDEAGSNGAHLRRRGDLEGGRGRTPASGGGVAVPAAAAAPATTAAGHGRSGGDLFRPRRSRRGAHALTFHRADRVDSRAAG